MQVAKHKCWQCGAENYSIGFYQGKKWEPVSLALTYKGAVRVRLRLEAQPPPPFVPGQMEPKPRRYLVKRLMRLKVDRDTEIMLCQKCHRARVKAIISHNRKEKALTGQFNIFDNAEIPHKPQ